MLKIALNRQASRTLRTLPSPTAKRIRGKINQLALDEAGLRNMIKALKGTGDMRLRVGDWRVIYAIEGDALVITRIAHRREAYR